MHLFSRHVSRTVASDIWEHRDQFLEGGRPRPQRQRVTVFFVDVKSFTPVAEGLDPLELMDWVNELMGMLASEAEAHGGFVDDFFGDGMKADFGVPMPREAEEEVCADAVAAVNCAISIEAKLADLNETWIARGQPIGRLRVGIDSGFAVVGEVGSSDRMKYTVLGDTANTAARLESLTDDDHDFDAKLVRVLVSHRTRELLGDHFELFDHGEVTLKGKSQKIRAIEILGPMPAVE
jgi:adenylate cyclase